MSHHDSRLKQLQRSIGAAVIGLLLGAGAAGLDQGLSNFWEFAPALFPLGLTFLVCGLRESLLYCACFTYGLCFDAVTGSAFGVHVLLALCLGGILHGLYRALDLPTAVGIAGVAALAVAGHRIGFMVVSTGLSFQRGVTGGVSLTDFAPLPLTTLVALCFGIIVALFQGPRHRGRVYSRRTAAF